MCSIVTNDIGLHKAQWMTRFIWPISNNWNKTWLNDNNIKRRYCESVDK